MSLLPPEELLPQLHEFCEDCAHAESFAALEAHLAAFTHRLGFQWFTLTHVTDMTRGDSGTVRLTNYPEMWRVQYDAQKLYRIDPILQALERSSTPLFWDHLTTNFTLTRSQAILLADAAKHGLRHGISIPIRVPGEYHGAVSFASDAPIDFRGNGPFGAQIAAPAAFERARLIARAGRHNTKHEATVITPRQRDCVTLAAQGKSDWEIGKILGISEKTVHGYIESVRDRYGVRRRVQLIIRALYDGRISFHEVL